MKFNKNECMVDGCGSRLMPATAISQKQRFFQTLGTQGQGCMGASLGGGYLPPHGAAAVPFRLTPPG